MEKSGWWSFRLSLEVRKQLVGNDPCAILIKSYLTALVRQGARLVGEEGSTIGLVELYNREYLPEPKVGTHTIVEDDLKNLSALPFVKILRRNESWPVPAAWNPKHLNSDQLEQAKAAHIKQGMKHLTDHLIPYFMDTEEDWYIFDRYAIAPAGKRPDNFIARRILPLVLIFHLIDRLRAGMKSTIHICCSSIDDNSIKTKEELVEKFKQEIKGFNDKLKSDEISKILSINRDTSQSKISMKFYNTRSTTDFPLNNHERFLVGKYWGLYMGHGLEEFSKYLLPDTVSKQLIHLSIFPSTAYRGPVPFGTIEMELIDKISRTGVNWCNNQRPVGEITI